LESLILANEVTEESRRKKKPSIVFKANFEKAYCCDLDQDDGRRSKKC